MPDLDERDIERRWKSFLSQAPPVGSLWRHRVTGGVYTVVMLSLRESDLAPLVTYRPEGRQPPAIWTRSWAEFRERFEAA